MCQYTYFDDLETIVNDFSHFVSAQNKITILIMIRTSAVNAMGKSAILRGSRNFLPQMYPMSFHHRFCVFDLPCLLTNSIWFMKFSAPHTATSRHKIQLFELFPLSGFMIFSSSSSEMHSMIYKVMLEGEGGLIFE